MFVTGAKRRADSMQPIVRRWKFRVEDPDGEGCYVGPDGKQDSECEWIGTDAEASAEAQRRADAWENATNGLCMRVVYESRGQVKANNGVTGKSAR
jgi:hypothetical protein